MILYANGGDRRKLPGVRGAAIAIFADSGDQISLHQRIKSPSVSPALLIFVCVSLYTCEFELIVLSMCHMRGNFGSRNLQMTRMIKIEFKLFVFL